MNSRRQKRQDIGEGLDSLVRVLDERDNQPEPDLSLLTVAERDVHDAISEKLQTWMDDGCDTQTAIGWLPCGELSLLGTLLAKTSNREFNRSDADWLAAIADGTHAQKTAHYCSLCGQSDGRCSKGVEERELLADLDSLPDPDLARLTERQRREYERLRSFPVPGLHELRMLRALRRQAAGVSPSEWEAQILKSMTIYGG